LFLESFAILHEKLGFLELLEKINFISDAKTDLGYADGIIAGI
jgi:hypothetical protein